MRLFLSETQLIAGGLLLGLGIFVGNLVNAAPPRLKARTSKKATAKKYPSRQPRRRWDSDLLAHPSRSIYHRRLVVRATAYRPIDDPMEGGRWTKTERDGSAVHGVAVDPRVIPLGAGFGFRATGMQSPMILEVRSKGNGWIYECRVPRTCIAGVCGKSLFMF